MTQSPKVGLRGSNSPHGGPLLTLGPVSSLPALQLVCSRREGLCTRSFPLWRLRFSTGGANAITVILPDWRPAAVTKGNPSKSTGMHRIDEYLNLNPARSLPPATSSHCWKRLFPFGGSGFQIPPLLPPKCPSVLTPNGFPKAITCFVCCLIGNQYCCNTMKLTLIYLIVTGS